jgi:excisionase family DNA binding protein
MNNLLTTAQTAQRLGIVPQTVIAYAQTGKLLGSFIGRKWRFAFEDVDAFIASQRRSR